MTSKIRDVLVINQYSDMSESQKTFVCHLVARGETMPEIVDIVRRELRVGLTIKMLGRLIQMNPGKIGRLRMIEKEAMKISADYLVTRSDVILKKMLYRALADIDKRLDADIDYLENDITKEQYEKILDTLYILPPAEILRIRKHFTVLQNNPRKVIEEKPPSILSEEVEKEAPMPLSVEQLQEIQDAVKSGRAVDLQRARQPSLPPTFRYGEKSKAPIGVPHKDYLTSPVIDSEE